MSERTVSALWPLTRDQTLGFFGGIVMIAVGCLAAWWFRPKPAAAELVLRESIERLPGSSMRWFAFELPHAGTVDIAASTAQGERFSLHVAARPTPVASERGRFLLLAEFSAENASTVRKTGELARGHYHLVVMRTVDRAANNEPAELHLRIYFRPVRRHASRSRRRASRRGPFPDCGVPAESGSPPAPHFGVRVYSRHWRAVARLWCALAGAGIASAASEPAAEVQDTLVFKNGDRIQGVLVSRQANAVVFKSERFGEIRAIAADVVVIPGEKAPTPGPKFAAKVDVPAAAPTAADRAEAENASRWDRFSLSVLTARLRGFFGPWRGRLAVSTEAVVDNTERSSSSVDATLRRKWSRDELQVKGRYDYAETNENPTTDVLRASASWRRDFTKTYFAHYQPSAEWNRASKRQGLPNDYTLLQQEIGAGIQLFTSATRKVRTGLSHNRFDTWNSAPVADRHSTSVQSIFEEVELKLPWRIGITHRGVWYPVPDQRDGWDGRIELNKKLTETLSIAFRYEIRRNNPDGSAQDYNKTRLLLGLDF